MNPFRSKFDGGFRPRQLLLVSSLAILGLGLLVRQAAAGPVYLSITDDFANRATLVHNDASSTDVVMVRALHDGTNTYYLVPPGQFAEVDGAEVRGGIFETVEGSCPDQSATVNRWRVTDVKNYEMSADNKQTWTPVTVGDTLISCMWYRRTVSNDSWLYVTDQNGQQLCAPKTDVIQVVVPHHVPYDPELRLPRSSGLASLRYSLVEVIDEMNVMLSGDTELPLDVPSIGALTSVAEVIIPRRRTKHGQ